MAVYRFILRFIYLEYVIGSVGRWRMGGEGGKTEVNVCIIKYRRSVLKYFGAINEIMIEPRVGI